MNRTRDFSFTTKLGSVAGMVMFGVLVLGSQPGNAAPAPPVGPTNIQPPIVTPVPPVPPKPKPCEVIKCVPPTLEPCFVLPGHTCTPPTLEPCKPEDCKPPTDPPTKPPTLTPRPPKTTHPTTPTNPPTGSIPTPNRIDTGEGPADEGRGWLFWLAPGFGVFALGAGVTGLWLLRRSEGSHR